MTTPAKLTLRGVTKSFGSQQVLHGIDLDVAESDVISLIGASGSGKSTLLRCVNLLEQVDDGSILLGDLDLTTPGLNPDPIRRRIGMVFQSFHLFRHLSALDNVALARSKVLDERRRSSRDHARGLLDRFGLGDKTGSYPDQLSGGQQQRVAIARALAVEPEVLLLDEITSALDPELVGEVLDVVRELKRDGLTMILATHEMGFAREISDRVCFLHEGRILEQGPPDQVLANPVEERTRQFLQRVIDAKRM